MELAKIYIENQPYEQIYSLEDGLFKGTIFPCLYSKYKYEVKTPIDFKDKKERIKVIIMELNFAIIELNLYLDTHPKNTGAMHDLLIYQSELKKMVDYYEQNYCALKTIKQNEDLNYFSWASDPWPWEDK